MIIALVIIFEYKHTPEIKLQKYLQSRYNGEAFIVGSSVFYELSKLEENRRIDHFIDWAYEVYPVGKPELLFTVICCKVQPLLQQPFRKSWKDEITDNYKKDKSVSEG